MNMHPKNAPTPGSLIWQRCVNHRLRHGYGVEDIAVQMHCAVERVREYVHLLREEGKLEAVVSARLTGPALPAQ